MPVTEVAILELVHPHTVNSPSIREFFRKAGTHQAKWSGYPVWWFESTSAPSRIYLISGWAGVEAHEEWIVSAENKALLKEGEGLIVVIDLMHVEIDFATMPAGTERVVWMRVEGLDPRVDNLAEEELGKMSESSGAAVGRILDKGVRSSAVRIQAFYGKSVMKERCEENEEESGQLTREGRRMVLD